MLKFNFEEQLKNVINNFAKSKGIEEPVSFVVEIPPKNINDIFFIIFIFIKFFCHILWYS